MTACELVRFLGFGCAMVLMAAASAEDSRPKRVPWTTSRIHGSPEPPKPFVAQQVYPKLQFKEALEIVFEPLSRRWFVLERGGKILSFPHDGGVSQAGLVADLKVLHPDLDHLYGIAFHPKYAENRQVFITYTRGAGIEDGTKLSRFVMQEEGPPEDRRTALDMGSEQIILTWRSGGHNGANLQFGPDGLLYISTGDAEVPAPPDPLNTGQDISDLLSSILRIDVDHKDAGLAYAIPKDNPFTGTKVESAQARERRLPGVEGRQDAVPPSGLAPARGEVWAYGLRNPWKMSFDRTTGRLWCGDVGWELWEMIHLIERGGNYGWSAMEASQPVRADAPKAPTPIRPPVVAHSHDEAASVTGGHVYHGKKYSDLKGAYIYGDYETGKIWALWHDGTRVMRHEEIAGTHHKIIAFGQDADGEVIYLDYSTQGAIYELVRNKVEKTEKFPVKLSETGLLKSINSYEWADGVYEFGINAPMWQDGEWITRGSFNSHFIALPNTSVIKTTVSVRNNKSEGSKAIYKTEWPIDAVLVKNMCHEHDGGMRLIETQILHHDGAGWNAYSYRWDENGGDATLVPDAGDGRQLLLENPAGPDKKRKYTWRFPSRAECLRCHNSWCNTALAFHPSQISNLDEKVPTGRSAPDREHGRGLDELMRLGLIDSKFVEQAASRLVSPYHKEEALNDRARSYLHVNCSHCHRKNAGGAVNMMLNAELLLGETRTVGVKPQQGGLGLARPRLIEAGNPWNSVICVRLAKTGTGHMPVIGPREVDVEGLKLIEDWIARMGNQAASAADLLPKEWNETLLKAKLATVDGGMQVLRAVDDGLVKEPLRQKALELAWSSPQPTVRDLFDRFLPDDKRAETLGMNPDPRKILALKGDAKRGAQLLSPQGKLAACFACHFINGTGRDFGPDLSKVGTRLKPEQILESLIKPSKVISQGYATIVVELKDGPAQTGFIVKETAGELSVKAATGQTVTIQKSDIAKQTRPPVSLMPEGLLQSFTAQEAADLVGFLSSLK